MTKTLIAALMLTSLAGAATAHVTLQETQAAAGQTTKITLRVPHGCDGQATTAISVTLPEGFDGVKPMPKPGWTLAIDSGADGKTAHVITWSGGDLPDAYYDEFVLRGTVAKDVAPGTVLAFPTAQSCGGTVEHWEGQHAPKLSVTAALSDAMPMAHDHAAMAGSAQLGDLTLSDGFTRATLPHAPVGGGFVTITNTGKTDDRLVSASTPVAGETQIHEMKMQGDVMKMAELPDGIVIPAGQTVTLAPGGYHLMFMKLAQPLVEGGSVPLTLNFEKAGSVTITLKVAAPNAKTAGDMGGQMGGQMGGMDMSHAGHDSHGN